MEAGINGASRPPPQPFFEDEGDDLQNSSIRSQDNVGPPRTPPKPPISTRNTQATKSNNNYTVAGAGANDISESDDPADFYRDYRGSPSAHGQGDIAVISNESPHSRQSPSSLRSNGNGTTPKYPSISSNRTALQSTNRISEATSGSKTSLNTAKSSPSLNGYPSSQTPKVKDLMKKFDYKEPPLAKGRVAAPRAASKEYGPSPPSYLRARTPVENRRPTGSTKVNTGIKDEGRKHNLATGATTARTTTKTKFSTVDQQSNNVLSSSPRPVRTRNQISGNMQASQSMTSLSPTSSPSSPKSPKAVKRKPLLFGEVVPESFGHSAAGYGIPDNTSRRTSDSGFHPSRQTHPANPSDDEAPSSPTAWYRGFSPAADGIDAERTPRALQDHQRSQSESSNTKIGDRVSPASRDDAELLRITSPSKLPVSSKRFGSQASFSSPPHAVRAPSTPKLAPPFTARPQKPPPRPWSPPGRATTPVPRSPQRQIPSPHKLATGSTTLKAHVDFPAPKLSPPLRSSKLRQTISSAATSDKQSTKTGSSQQTSSPKSTRSGTSTSKITSRHANTGPVDYAAHRARIQRTYSKRIQEAEHRELQQQEARRANEEAFKFEEDVIQSNQGESLSSTVKSNDHLEEATLTVNTSLLSPKQALHNAPHKASAFTEKDSPILGIPGSYPEGDDTPVSAVSNVTEFTEFDVDSQTEAAKQTIALPLSSSAVFTSSADISQAGLPEPSTRNLDDDGSINIVLDTTSLEEGNAYEDSSDRALRPNLAVELPTGTQEVPYGEPLVENFKETLLQHGHQSFDHRSRSSNHNDHTGSHVSGNESLHDLRTQLQLEDDDLSEEESGPALESHHALYTQLPELDTKFASEHIMSQQNNLGNFATPVTDIDYESSDDADNQFSLPFAPPATTIQPTNQNPIPIDDSIDLVERTSWLAHPDHQSRLPPLPFHDAPPPPPPKEGPQVPPKSTSYSPQPSPSSNWDTPQVFNSPQTLDAVESPNPNHEADVATASRRSSIVPLVPPPYSPPPPPPAPPQLPQMENSFSVRKHSPPPPSLHNRRHPSSLYRSSYKEPDSRRASGEDLYSSRPSISSPRSNSQMSMDQDTFTRQTSVDEQQHIDTQVDPVEVDRATLPKEHRRLRHRQMTIKELIDTESVYLKDMNVVEEIYKGTAEACPKLDHGDIKTIFRNTDQLVAFTTKFLDDLKAAAVTIYTPRAQRSRQSRITNSSVHSNTDDVPDDSDWARDRLSTVGATFLKHTKEMQTVYADFLKSSEQASSRLLVLQSDSAVQVWLNECNQVAKDLTAAWDLDALLVKPVQRITRYQLLLGSIREDTPEDHPDYDALCKSCLEIVNLLTSIDDLKKRIDAVSKIVGRKRKESDVKSNLSKSTIARAFGRRDNSGRRDKGPPISTDDDVYKAAHSIFAEDYIRLQIIFRDTENHIRALEEYVVHFLTKCSAIELVMRIGTSSYPEIESKWTQFNKSMASFTSGAIELYRSEVHKHMIEPFEKIIKAYNQATQFMAQRNKRRQDYEKSMSLKSQGKKVDEKLNESSKQYEALNDTLKLELPKLRTMTTKMGKLCVLQFVRVQSEWFRMWEEKLKSILEESHLPQSLEDIINIFNRDFKYFEARVQELGIASGIFSGASTRSRHSHSTMSQSHSFIRDDDSNHSRSHPPTLDSRPRGLSLTSDNSPSLPTPDFGRTPGQFTFSPVTATHSEIPQIFTRDFPINGQYKIESGSSGTPDTSLSSRTYSGRPSTSRSIESATFPRASAESNEARRPPYVPGDYSQWVDGSSDVPVSSRPFSGMFHSAMPPDDPDDSRRSSRASSRERGWRRASYNVLFLAASLFEFNISAKSEAGYPYLTYQAGEIFDVVAEKGEIWLAKNQDDPAERVGWIWSKHFARLATD